MTGSITAIILAHYKERQDNLKRIIDDLYNGSVVPQKTIVFIDNPEIELEDKRVVTIRSSDKFLPRIRFALGSVVETDYCFFIDDDLSVREQTLGNFMFYAKPKRIVGYEGSILGDTETPYANDTSINRGDKEVEVDVIIRTYFVPTNLITAGLQLQADHPELPRKSLDDVYLCLGNKYVNRGQNLVIPVNDQTDMVELNEGGVGQSFSGKHYENRNLVCRRLINLYEKAN